MSQQGRTEVTEAREGVTQAVSSIGDDGLEAILWVVSLVHNRKATRPQEGCKLRNPECWRRNQRPWEDRLSGSEAERLAWRQSPG